MQCLWAEDLVKTYQRRQVVNKVSVRVDQGSVVGLLGPNGAGKSTAMGIIAGTIRPKAGTVSLGPIVLDTMPLWKRVRAGLGYLPQEPSLLRDCTVRDNLILAAEGCRSLITVDFWRRVLAILVRSSGTGLPS